MRSKDRWPKLLRNDGPDKETGRQIVENTEKSRAYPEADGETTGEARSYPRARQMMRSRQVKQGEALCTGMVNTIARPLEETRKRTASGVWRETRSGAIMPSKLWRQATERKLHHERGREAPLA